MSPRRTRRRRVFGHLDADRLLAGDRREDADVGRGQRVGEVVGELGDFLHLGAGREAQLEARDVRAADDADDLGLDAEVAERLDQLAADRLVVARVGTFVAFALFEHLGRGRPVVDLLGFGDAALVAHRGQRGLLGLGVGADAEPLLARAPRPRRRGAEARRPGPGRERRARPRRTRSWRAPPRAVLGDRHGRFELVVLGIGAHHVGRARLGLEGGGALFAAPLLAVLDRRLGDVATAGEGVADAAAEAAEDGRDRGAGDEHRADREHQHGRDPRADVAEQVLEPGFEAVADLAAVPAEEEDEDEVDPGGDQEEADQVEMALLQALGQMRPREARALGSRLAFRLAARGRASLLAHEHGPASTPRRRLPCLG